MNERRISSILKPAKARNPLSDIDLDPSPEDVTKQLRRVSFANNRIKEFTKGPEDQTIWQDSYEEINSTSSYSKESTELQHSDPLNCTTICIDDDDNTMEFTEAIHGNIVTVNKNENIKNSTSSCSKKSTELQHSDPLNCTTICIDDGDNIGESLNNTMEFTEAIHDNIVTVNKNKNSNKKRQTIHFTETDVEFTQTLPSHIDVINKENISTLINTQFNGRSENDMDFTYMISNQQSLHLNQPFDDSGMEFTNVRTNFILNQNQCQSKRKTIHFNSTSEDCLMDMTVPFDDNFVENPNRILENNQQDYSLDNMEFTFSSTFKPKPNQQVEYFDPGLENVKKISKNKSKRQTIHFNQMSQDADMNITCPIETQVYDSNKLCGKNVNIETKSKPVKNKTKRQTIHFNQMSENADMDITFSAETHFYESTKIFEKNVETHDVKRQTIHFNRKSLDADLDITTPIKSQVYYSRKSPAENVESITKPESVENNDKIKRKTIHFNQMSLNAGMDMTLPIETHLAETQTKPELMENNNFIKKKTIHFNRKSQNVDLDITPPIKSQVYYSRNSPEKNVKIQTKMSPKETELIRSTAETQTTPGLMENNNINRKTIHFNQTSPKANMDITVPIETQFYQSSKFSGESVGTEVKSEFVENKTKRQTVHFNQISPKASMDITAPIETIVYQSTKLYEKNLEIQTKSKSEETESKINQTSQNVNVNINIPIEELVQSSESTEPESIENRNKINCVETETEFDNFKRQTIHFEECNMEFTAVISPTLRTEINEQIEDSEDQNMDCKKLKQELDGNQSKERNDKKFNEESNTDIVICSKTQFEIPVSVLQSEKEYDQKLNEKSNVDSVICSKMKSEIPVIVLQSEKENDQKLNEESNVDIVICSETQSEIPVSASQSEKENDQNLNGGSNVDIAICSKTQSKIPVSVSQSEKQNDKKFNEESNTDIVICSKTQSEIPVSASQLEQENDQNFNEESNIGIVIRSKMQSKIPINVPRFKKVEVQNVENRIEVKQISDVNETKLNPIENDQITDEKIGRINEDWNVNSTTKIILENRTETELTSNEELYSPLKETEQEKKIEITSNQDLENCDPIIIDLTDDTKEDIEMIEEIVDESKYFYTINSENNLKNKYCFIQEEIVDKDEEDMSLNKSKLLLVDVELETENSKKIQIPIENSIISITEQTTLNNTVMEEEDKQEDENDYNFLNILNKKTDKMQLDETENILLETENQFVSVMSSDISTETVSFLNINDFSIKEKLDVLFPCIRLNKDEQQRNIKKKTVITKKERNVNELLNNFLETIIRPKQVTENNDREEQTGNLETIIKQKSVGTLWKLINSNNNVFTFTFMYDTIEFVVTIDTCTKIVENVKESVRFSKTKSHPIAVYVNHVLMTEKITPLHIKSACGQSYNIFSFIDYLSVVGEQVLQILEEFNELQLQYGLHLDSNLNATFSVINTLLCIAFEVTVNLMHLDNNILNEYIHINKLIGNVNETAIKKLANGCPRGFSFLRSYIMSVNQYVEILVKSKLKS